MDAYGLNDSENTNVTDFLGQSNYDMSRESDAKFQKRIMLMIASFGVFLVLSVIHIINWDQHSFEIIPLKISYYLGMAGPTTLRELSRICENRMKYECAISTLSDSVKQDPNFKDYLRLSHLQRKTGDFANAIGSYNATLNLVHKESAGNSSLSSEIYYGLARSYEGLGQAELALSNYESSLKSKDEVIQITVTSAYLKLLQKLGRQNELKTVIAEARKRSGSESLFSEFM